MLSLFNSLLGWVFRVATIKFVVFAALALVLTPLMALLMQLVESSGIMDFGAMIGGLHNDLRFYLVLFRLDFGLPLLLAATLTKFFIRRLPIVG